VRAASDHAVTSLDTSSDTPVIDHQLAEQRRPLVV
jgi:hypothetical protein